MKKNRNKFPWLFFICLFTTNCIFGQIQVYEDRVVDTTEANQAKVKVETFTAALLTEKNDSLINILSIPFTVVNGNSLYQANSKDSLSKGLEQIELIFRNNNCLNIISCKLSNSFGDDDGHELYFFDIMLNTKGKNKLKINICAKMFNEPLIRQFTVE
jgi:hypothetical protein